MIAAVGLLRQRQNSQKSNEDLEVHAMKQSEQLKAALERFSMGESRDAYRFMGCHRQV